MQDALSSQPDAYSHLEQALSRIDCDYSPAEAHGMACGLLVINQSVDPAVWLKTVVTGDPKDFYVQEAKQLLRDLFNTTRQQMNGEDLDFAVFLPEAADLALQVYAMQAWCQGFGLGLAQAGIKDLKKLPTDSREWVEDVVNIGASGELDLDEQEESETAFMELVEYLRVGILMMNEEMQPLKTSPQVH